VYKRRGDQQDANADPQLLTAQSAARRKLRHTIVAAICLLAGVAAGFGAAGGGRGAFTVNISLNSGRDSPAPTDVCTSESLSEATGAVVRVVCETGQFVSIGPRPGGRFVDTHGGAYTYYFGPSFGAIHRAGSGEFASGAGTIVSYRVYNVTEADGQLDMLVSF